MVFDEFTTWLSQAAERVPLHVVLARDGNRHFELWDGSERSMSSSHRVYLASERPDLGRLDVESFSPGQLGWVQVDVPREAGESLLLCQMAAKSDWFDSETSSVEDNQQAIRLFEKVWRQLKGSLAFPIWVRNVVTDAESPYRAIGCTDGAAKRFREGWQLRQEGAENLRFEIRSED